MHNHDDHESERSHSNDYTNGIRNRTHSRNQVHANPNRNTIHNAWQKQ